jgi:hypothetical protein
MSEGGLLIGAKSQFVESIKKVFLQTLLNEWVEQTISKSFYKF